MLYARKEFSRGGQLLKLDTWRGQMRDGPMEIHGDAPWSIIGEVRTGATERLRSTQGDRVTVGGAAAHTLPYAPLNVYRPGGIS